MFVIKRNGLKENVKFDKITNRINKLLEGIDNTDNIDPVLITQKICNRIYPGITTTELDILASEVCMSMVTENPNFGILGSRLAISNHQKNTKENFLEVVTDLENNTEILSNELIEITKKFETEINNIINYERDYLLDYFGFKTLERSYLLKINKKPVERPQHLFMRVAIGIHGEDLINVKKTYDNISLKNYTHATPTLFNAGTRYPQLSSCFLTQVEDSIEGIFETYTDCGLISKFAGGIGCDISNIRAKGSYIRKTGGISDGLMPLLRTFNSIARQFNQGGKRLGSFAMYVSDWHLDIFDFLEAKKNHGAEDERARDLFYAMWISDLFMEKVENNEDWFLMCPDTCKGLQNVYGEDFNILYTKYVQENKFNKKIKARELWEAIIGSQVETGTPYMLYKDSCNKKSNQKNLGTIKSSNLCSEILEYVSKDEISVCNLASICLPSMLENPVIESFIPNVRWIKLLNTEEKVLYNYFYEGKLKLYSKEDCDYCKLLKSLLDKSGLYYDEINKEDAEKYRIMSEPNMLNMKPFETVPQLFSFYKDKIYHLGGYDNCWKILKPRINYNKLYNMSYELTINLNKIIDKNFYPIEKTRTSNLRHRPIGIGVQGLADLFIKLKLPFDSSEAMQINKEIFETIYYGAMTSSIDIAEKEGYYSTFEGSPLSKGEFQFNLWGLKDEDLSGRYDWNSLRDKAVKNGARNSLLIALMPTASTSQILGSNECFEPITSNIYNRRTLAGEFTVINKYLVEDLLTLDLWNQDTKDRLIYDKGSVKNIKGLPTFIKDIYKTVWEISQKNIIQMSADRGPFVCQSQSLNLFFEKPTFKILHSAHFTGWKLGLKTGSYYIRSKPATGSQRFGFDPIKEKELKKEDEECLNCSA
jgi:ribonucleoside-diphosphate reductase alpha subunit